MGEETNPSGRLRPVHSRAGLLLVGGLLVGGLLVLAACGGDGDGDDTSGSGGTGIEGDGDDSSGSRGTGIEVAFNDTLGEPILVDGAGRTVYMLDWDTDGTATCTPSLTAHPLCHKVLPPVTGEPTGGDGVDASKLGTTTRDDGITQVTYARHPLYYFGGGYGYTTGDRQPGQLLGQGFFDVVWVLSPDGTPIRGAGGSSLPTQPSNERKGRGSTPVGGGGADARPTTAGARQGRVAVA